MKDQYIDKDSAFKLRMLVIMCLIIFLDSLGNFITLPIIFRITHQYSNLFFSHLSKDMQNTLFGATLFVTPLFGIVVSPFFGRLSDILGRKNIISMSLLLSILSYIFFIMGIAWKNFIIILLAKILAGVSSNSQPIAEASVTDMVKEEKKRSYYIGFIAFSLIMAMITGPLLGAYLSDHNISSSFNLYTPIWVGLTLSFLSIFVLFVMYKETNLTYAKYNINQNGITELFFNRSAFVKIARYLAIFFLLQFSWAIFYQYMPIFLQKRYQFSIDQASFFLSILSTIMGLGLLALYYFIVKIIPLAKIVAYCCIIAFLSLLAFYALGKFIYLYGMIYALVIGLYYPALVTIMTNKLSHDKHGWLMGCNTSLMNIAWLVSSGLITLFATFKETLMAILGIFAILLATMLLLLHDSIKK